MKLHLAATILCIVATPASAQAKIEFSAYEGPEQIVTGQGGTKITKNGIDYWTSGTPPRRYQVIGRITDKRDEDWDGGHAIGSPTVAKKVKRAGGSAVIMLDQNDVAGSSAAFGSFYGGTGTFFGGGGSKTLTIFMVVRYLD